MTLYIDTRPELQWFDYYGRFMADGYEVRFEASNGKWYWMYYDQCEDQAYYEDPYNAKAAAQADYDRRTAERFRAVELPTIPFKNPISEYFDGYNDAVEEMEHRVAVVISKAKEQP